MSLTEYLKKKYGTDDANVIIKAKTDGKQTRSGVSPDKPEHVTMSMDDCKSLCTKAGITYEKGYEERVIRYTCSDGNADRAGDVIKQNGWHLKNFKSNPVIMANHNYGEFPVGNALSAGVDGGKLKMQVLFAGKDVSEKADEAFKLSKAGFMRAGSVGFMPLKHHMPDEAEQKELGMEHAAGVVFDEQDLLEFSVCGVPMNPGALQDSMEKGLTNQKDIDFLNILTKKKDDDKDKEKPNKKDIDISSEIVGKAFEHLINKEVNAKLEKLIEEKQGAVLSKQSKAHINTAVKAMLEGVNALKALLGEDVNEEDENEKEKGKNQDTNNSTEDSLIIDVNLDDITEPTDGEALYFDLNLS